MERIGFVIGKPRQRISRRREVVQENDLARAQLPLDVRAVQVPAKVGQMSAAADDGTGDPETCRLNCSGTRRLLPQRLAPSSFST